MRAFATILLSSLLLTGCTVAPKVIRDSGPSFDGGERNSGFLGYTTNGHGVITAHARDRYNAMIATGYGTNFLPAIKPDYGISQFTNGTFLITPEALVDFATMNRKRKSGQ